MKKIRTKIDLVIALSATLFVAACGDGSQVSNFENPVPGETVLRRGNEAEPRSLDPHRAQSSWESNILGDMLMGLTIDGPDARTLPAAAETWETSADGLHWTFHLRDHNWSDGTPVSAEDFVFAWRRMLDPATAAPYASLLYVFKNAEAINAGDLPPDTLGATAINERTLELELESPAPYLDELFSNFTTYPVPRHVIAAHGDDWMRPGNYVGNGPYTLAEWVPNDHITLIKNDAFYDAENVAIDRVVYYPTSDFEAALRRFRAGELDTQERLPPGQIDWLRANIPETMRIEPFLGVEYVAINHTRAPLDDVRVREALNLGLNREIITDQILRIGNLPAYGVVPPGIANYPGGNAMAFRDMPQQARVVRAQSLMREAGYGPENRLALELAVRSAAPDARRVPAAMQQMWGEIYVDIDIVQADGAVTYAKIQEGDYDLGLVNWTADFNDARNFLFLLMGNNGKNYSRYRNPAFDALIEQSDNEADSTRRGALMAEAEALALNDFPWIPVYYRVTSDLVHVYVKGWISNVEDANRTRWLSIENPANP